MTDRDRETLEKWEADLRGLDGKGGHTYEISGRAALVAADAICSLLERSETDRAVCLCGCPPDEHENYGEDGESCASPEHDCLRVCEAARTAHVALLERLEAAERDRDAAIGSHHSAMDRIRALERERDAWMSSSKDHHDEARELREEVERHEENVRYLRKLVKSCRWADGGNVENDPTDAIIRYVVESANAAMKENERLSAKYDQTVRSLEEAVIEIERLRASQSRAVGRGDEAWKRIEAALAIYDREKTNAKAQWWEIAGDMYEALKGKGE